MESVLLSIQPKWCELIARGMLIVSRDIKEIEVRKTRPQIDTPFKCFIYCTKGGAGLIQTVYAPMHCVGRGYNNIQLSCYKDYKHCKDMRDCVNGKVIGEFICDKIYEIRNLGSSFMIGNDIALTNRIARESCLQFADLCDYLGNKNGYAWHISDLKIYDKPKELTEFKRPHNRANCGVKDCGYSINGQCGNSRSCDHLTIRKAPQSWCFAEVV